jgi:nicotinamidase-related amidase
MDGLPKNTALIVVDVQQGFDDPQWGIRNNPEAEQNIANLLKGWRTANRPIFHIRHKSLAPGSVLAADSPGGQVKREAASLPDEPVIFKRVHSGFIGTDLERRLREAGIETVVIAGITTDHCVSTTARMAADLDFKVYVVSDATVAFDRVGIDGTPLSAQTIHDVNLASLNGEFATVLTTSALLTTR